MAYTGTDQDGGVGYVTNLGEETRSLRELAVHRCRSVLARLWPFSGGR